MTDTKPTRPRKALELTCCEDCFFHFRNKVFEDEPILCGHGETFDIEIDMDALTDEQPFPDWCPLPEYNGMPQQ